MGKIIAFYYAVTANKSAESCFMVIHFCTLFQRPSQIVKNASIYTKSSHITHVKKQDFSNSENGVVAIEKSIVNNEGW